VLTPENEVDFSPAAEPRAVVHGYIGSAERRKRTRMRLRWRVDLLVLNATGAIETVTRDLSSCGFYCWSPISFVVGDRMTCILTAPAHCREKPDCILSIECQVRIVRTEPPNKDGFYGLGCEINDYRLSHA